MDLSFRVEYALAALLDMASQSDPREPIQVKLIAARQEIPDRYLEHIFNTLRRAGIVRSQRGMRGGYLLARQPQQITVLEVFECLEDNKMTKQTDTAISINRLVVREIWQEAHQKAEHILRGITLQDLYQQRLEREPLNTMYYI
jgi:Rrf2 family transcriptional regulator, cysteine metabolism repressor